jgi:formylglycine-generating enzyme required for sulfatase activity
VCFSVIQYIMPKSNHRLKVFIYHVQSDRNIAQALCELLLINGVDAILPEDEPDILAWEQGDEKLQGADEIKKVIWKADTVLFCISDEFNKLASMPGAEWRSVLDAAREKRLGAMQILPVCLEECEVPSLLGRWQSINLYEENGYENLMNALKVRADSLGAELARREDWKENPFATETGTESGGRAILRYSLPILGMIVLVALFIMAVLFQTGAENVQFATRTAQSVGALAERATQNVYLRATERAATATAFVAPADESRMQTSVFQTADPLTKTATAEQALYTFTPSLTSVVPTQIKDAGIPMMFVPQGSFIMGSGDGSEDVKPATSIYLVSYYIDQYEVTNGLYKVCVLAGACQPPKLTASQTRPNYYDAFEFANYPLINVDWYMAQAYCKWRGARLPTEAEWEKAARGPDALLYPWGSETGCLFANYNASGGLCMGDTSAADKYVAGRSVYGVLNMAGNVSEWVSSLSKPYPYNSLDGREDPDATGLRVVRGGSWASPVDELLTSHRISLDPAAVAVRGNDLGFRCVRDSSP